jgi:hypothetical protein
MLQYNELNHNHFIFLQRNLPFYAFALLEKHCEMIVVELGLYQTRHSGREVGFSAKKIPCQHRVDRVLSFFSIPPNWDFPPPHPQESLNTPPFGSGRGGTSLVEEGVEVPIQTRGQTLRYSRLTRYIQYVLCAC